MNHKIKLNLLLFLCMFSLTYSYSVEGQDSYQISLPVVEVFDLIQDGSLAVPYILNLTHDFSHVHRIIWHEEFAINAIDFDHFAGEASALTNGINLWYNEISLLDNYNITATKDFAITGDDFVHLQDVKNPIGHSISSHNSFDKFNPPHGLLINDELSLQIYIQDDLTALSSLTEFTVTVEGNKDLEIYVENDLVRGEDLLTTLENFIRDNYNSIITILLLGFTASVVYVWFRKR